MIIEGDLTRNYHVPMLGQSPLYRKLVKRFIKSRIDFHEAAFWYMRDKHGMLFNNTHKVWEYN